MNEKQSPVGGSLCCLKWIHLLASTYIIPKFTRLILNTPLVILVDHLVMSLHIT